MKARIKCCIKCVPPKRHPACHDTCKEYQDEKREYDREKMELRDLRYKEHEKIRSEFETLERHTNKRK